MHFPVSCRGKCIQPIHRFVPETHARSEKQRTFRVESFLRCGVCSFRVRAPMTPTTITGTVRTTKTTMAAAKTTTVTANKTTDEGSLGESRRDTSRAKILPGIHLGPSSSGVSEGSARRYGLSRWVTQGSTAPGGVL